MHLTSNFCLSRHLDISTNPVQSFQQTLIEAAGRAEREGPGGVPQTRPRALSTAPQSSAVVLGGARGTLPRGGLRGPAPWAACVALPRDEKLDVEDQQISTDRSTLGAFLDAGLPDQACRLSASETLQNSASHCMETLAFHFLSSVKRGPADALAGGAMPLSLADDVACGSEEHLLGLFEAVSDRWQLPELVSWL